MKPVTSLTDEEIVDLEIGLVQYLGMYLWRSDCDLQWAKGRLVELSKEKIRRRKDDQR